MTGKHTKDNNKDHEMIHNDIPLYSQISPLSSCHLRGFFTQEMEVNIRQTLLEESKLKVSMRSLP